MTEARKEKMDRITKMLSDGVNEVFNSDRYKEWLKVELQPFDSKR